MNKKVRRDKFFKYLLDYRIWIEYLKGSDDGYNDNQEIYV